MGCHDQETTCKKKSDALCDVPQEASFFISSTFRDMQSERDALRDVVLPRLREFVRPYGISADLVDLRWGVDTSSVAEKEQDSKVLSVCLAEIERCEPFFVLLLGDRYGYVPDDMAVSVTEWEIDHALEKTPTERRLLCCFRDIQNSSTLSQSQRDIFFDHGHDSKLDDLKKRLRRGYPSAILDYSVQVRQDGTYDLREFCDCVTEALETRLRDELGDLPIDSHHSLDVERARQIKYACELSCSFVGREGAVSALVEICHADGPLVVLVKGEPGAGKTSLMAKLTRELEGSCTTVPVFCGFGPETSDLFGMVRFLLRSLDPEGTDIESLYRMDYASLCDAFSRALTERAKHGPVVVLVDALDQLSGVQEGRLGWASFDLPKNCHIICTAIDGISEDEVSHAGGLVLGIPELSEGDARALVASVCARNHKEGLPERVVNTLISAARSGGRPFNPLWISQAVRHLLMLSRDDFRHVEELQNRMGISPIDAQAALMSARLAGLPPDCEGMYEILVEDAMTAMGTEEYPAALCAIAASRWGLRIEDLSGALGEGFDQVQFAWLRQLLSEDFVQRERLEWNFAHQSFRRSVSIRHFYAVSTVNKRKVIPYLMSRARETKMAHGDGLCPVHDERTRDAFVDQEVMHHLFLARDASHAADLLCLPGVYRGKRTRGPLNSVFWEGLAGVCASGLRDGSDGGFLLKIILEMRGRDGDGWCRFAQVLGRRGVFEVPQMHACPPEMRIHLLEEAICAAEETCPKSESLMAAIAQLHCETAETVYQFEAMLALGGKPTLRHTDYLMREKAHLEEAESCIAGCNVEQLASRTGSRFAVIPRVSFLRGSRYYKLACTPLGTPDMFTKSLWCLARYLEYLRAEKECEGVAHQLDLVSGLSQTLRVLVRLSKLEEAKTIQSELEAILNALNEDPLDAWGCRIAEDAWVALLEYWKKREKQSATIFASACALRFGLKSFVLWPQYANRITALGHAIVELESFGNVELREEECRVVGRLYMEVRAENANHVISGCGLPDLFIRVGLPEYAVRQAYLDERADVLREEDVRERRKRLDSLNATFAAYEESQGNYSQSDEVLAKMERALTNRLASPEGAVVNNSLTWERRLSQIRNVRLAREWALTCGAFKEPKGLECMTDQELSLRARALEEVVGSYSDLVGVYDFVQERATGCMERYYEYSHELMVRKSSLFDPWGHAKACIMLAGNIRAARVLTVEVNARLSGTKRIDAHDLVPRECHELLADCNEATAFMEDGPKKDRVLIKYFILSADMYWNVLDANSEEHGTFGKMILPVDGFGKPVDIRTVCMAHYLAAHKLLAKLSSPTRLDFSDLEHVKQRIIGLGKTFQD